MRDLASAYIEVVDAMRERARRGAFVVFDPSGGAVAVVDVTRVPARATSTSGATGTASGGPSVGPVAPLRLHVAHLRSNPRSGIGQWVCEFTWRYRRALGDSRRDAFRRALKCAHAHDEVTHVR